MSETPTVKRGRGRPADPEIPIRRRRELVGAAYEVFATKGYTASGIADITKHLGVAHGTFYQYFSSKRDILDHVFDFCVERIATVMLDGDLPAQATDLDSLVDQFQSISRKLFTLLTDEPAIVRIIMFESTGVDDAMRLRIFKMVEDFVAVTETYLAHGIDAGFVRTDLDRGVLAQAVNSLTIPGLSRILREEFDPLAEEQTLAALTAFLRAALSPL